MKFNQNPFRIPNLKPMLSKVKKYVRTAQKDRGYIDTQGQPHDTIYSFGFDPNTRAGVEMEVHGIRVTDGGDLQIVQKPIASTYYEKLSDDDFKDADWVSITDDPSVYFIPTIFNIAESIKQY